MARQVQQAKGIPVAASATVTTSASGSNLKNTANALPDCDALTLILDVTALSATTSVAGVISIDVYIDSSPDGGTTWYPSVHFAQVVASTNVQRLEMRPIGIGPTESASLFNLGLTINTTSVSSLNTVIAVDHRVRWAFNAAVSPSATFAVWALAQPFGTYGA